MSIARSLPRALALAGAALLALPLCAQDGADLAGLWRGELQAPDLPGPLVVELLLEPPAEDGRMRGSAAVEHDHSPVAGEYRPGERLALLEADFDDPTTITFAVKLAADGGLEGEVRKGALRAPVSAERVEGEPRFFHDRGFELPDERPLTVDATLLPDELAARLTERLVEAVERSGALGVSTAVVRGGELADVRSLGWEDVAGGVPASGRTMYRWASISKPLTAVAALQLAERDHLDLDRDVREYVPEFPAKPYPITARQLLCHQGGVVHYSNGEVIRTVREYEVEHPMADRVRALDVFKESPLVAVPGESYRYTTHGYALLGAVIQRAGGATYVEQVRARILEPLGMASTQPDHAWVAIPRRAVGYRSSRIGLGTLDPRREVSWKVPGGGWISTVGDLARFGLGLLEGRLLEPETQAEMATSQVPGDGRDRSYGYGIGTGTFEGHAVLSHSGSQSAAASYMLLCPGRGLGVFVMSGTRNFEPAPLAREMLSVLLEEPR